MIRAGAIGLGALLALENFGPLLVKKAGTADLLLVLINLVAPLCYLLALGYVGRILARFAEEGRFALAAAGALAGVGIALLGGSAFHILLAPSLSAALGHGPGYVFGLDAAEIALGGVGLGLWGFSRLFRRAAQLEQELDEFM